MSIFTFRRWRVGLYIFKPGDQDVAALREELRLVKEKLAKRDRPHANKPQPKDRATHEFWDAFTGGGSIVATCICNRVHFVDNDEADFDDGELEDYREREKAEPDKYTGHYDTDYVGTADIPGGIVVYECKCSTAAKYENFLIHWRRNILRYYKQLYERKNRDAEDLGASLKEAGF